MNTSKGLLSASLAVVLASCGGGTSNQSNLPDESVLGIDGRWLAKTTDTRGSSCDYTLQISDDFTWQDTSNSKYRSGTYTLEKSISEGKRGGAINLLVNNDNGLIDCQGQSYDTIGDYNRLQMSDFTSLTNINVADQDNTELLNQPLSPTSNLIFVGSSDDLPPLVFTASTENPNTLGKSPVPLVNEAPNLGAASGPELNITAPPTTLELPALPTPSSIENENESNIEEQEISTSDIDTENTADTLSETEPAVINETSVETASNSTEDINEGTTDSTNEIVTVELVQPILETVSNGSPEPGATSTVDSETSSGTDIGQNSTDNSESASQAAIGSIPDEYSNGSADTNPNPDTTSAETITETQQFGVDIDNTDQSAGLTGTSGINIKNTDWIVTKPENVKFGDHSGDQGYAPSRLGDFDAIRVRLQKGSNWGTGSYFLMPDNTQEAWVSFCVRFADNWNTSVGGKLPGFAGDSSPTNGGQGGAPATGNNAWSARMLYGSYDSSTDAIPLGHYVYHSAQSAISQYGDPEWWSPLPGRLFSKAARAQRMQWHSIKQRLKVNSKNQSDGIIESWVNGKKVYSRTDFNFTNNDKFLEIYRFWLDTYHGGGAKSPHDQYVYYDQINYSIGTDQTSTDCHL